MYQEDLSKFLRVNQNEFYNVLKKNKLEELKTLDELIRISQAKSLINKNNALFCQICMDNKISICLVPCGHCFCENCIKNDYKCHICNQKSSLNKNYIFEFMIRIFSYVNTLIYNLLLILLNIHMK